MVATFDDVYKLAEQLDTEQQNLLIYRLRVNQLEHDNPVVHVEIQPETSQGISRDDLLREVEILRQMPVREGDSLFGKYAGTDDGMTAEAFHAQMYAIATEWEKELDEFYTDES